jgi:thiol-disulfide isomerase/thioredoxin
VTPALRLAVCALALLAGCAAVRRLTGPPARARVHVLSLQQVQSGDQITHLASALEDQDGCYRAEGDVARAELKVWTRPELDPAALVRVVEAHGVRGLPAAGQGSYLPPRGYPAGADARLLTATGRDIPDLAVHAVPGKVTVFDFYADWCGPCRLVDKQLIRILSTRNDVAVRKLNIVSFATPAAGRWVSTGIPFLVIYGRSGKQLFQMTGSDPDAIAVALGRATLRRD